MKKVQIYLKSGRTIEITLNDVRIRRHPNGVLESVEWHYAPNGQKLDYVDLDDVEAITSELINNEKEQ